MTAFTIIATIQWKWLKNADKKDGQLDAVNTVMRTLLEKRNTLWRVHLAVIVL